MNDFWKQMLDHLLFLYINGSEEARSHAYEQLKQMAKEADQLNELEHNPGMECGSKPQP